MSLSLSTDPAGAIPEPSDALAAWFGDRLPLARRYAELLCSIGAERGMIGPREVDRIWERHVGNCAVIADLVPEHASVVDVGSGAGLPGVALAVARPDLSVTLVEPMLRRTTWLDEVVEELGLGRVRVVRGRAEELHGRLTADIVTSRAVARLDVLAGWCLPLAREGGAMLALKGAGAADEVREARAALVRAGAASVEVLECGSGALGTPTTVVRVGAGRLVRRGKARSRGGRASG